MSNTKSKFLKLKNKVAIITGSTSGIGKEIALKFSNEGALIVVNGRNKSRGEEVVEEIEKNGSYAFFLKGDISKPETNRELIRKTIKKFKRIDIIVTSAGELGLGSITEISIETWNRTISTNLGAVFYILHYGIPEMLKTGGGNVIVIGSIAAFKVFPNHPAYCTSKGALTQLVKQVALDYGPEIRINQICPGQVDTPLLRNSVQAFENPDKIIKETKNRLPLKRLGKPLDIAEMALFLVSEKASWITGSSIVVDGGSLCIP